MVVVSIILRHISRQILSYQSGKYTWELLAEFSHLKKSQSSAAESISACQAFLPWPAIVNDMTSYRYFVDIKSAAFKKMLALSAHGVAAQSLRAERAAAMAASTSALEAFE
jgi:hypothetical protein